MEYRIQDPPPRGRAKGGRSGPGKTKYQFAIDAAQDNPGQWIEVTTVMSSGNVSTFRERGLKVTTRTTDREGYVRIWLMHDPDDTGPASPETAEAVDE